VSSKELEYLTKQQYADILQISYATVNRRIADGTIKAIKFGAQIVRIPSTELP
jgi:excisionase family DNA binding protein